MAILIDVNVIPTVFCTKSLKHAEFEPVLKWILEGKGLMVYGGSKYKEELGKLGKYLKIIRSLKSFKKAIEIDALEVDRYQKIVEDKEDNLDFDDPHLIAICAVSKCRIICSEDLRSIKFVQNSKFYPKNFHIPKYFTSKRNRALLQEKYIDDSFKPLLALNKDKKITIMEVLSSN